MIAKDIMLPVAKETLPIIRQLSLRLNFSYARIHFSEIIGRVAMYKSFHGKFENVGSEF